MNLLSVPKAARVLGHSTSWLHKRLHLIQSACVRPKDNPRGHIRVDVDKAQELLFSELCPDSLTLQEEVDRFFADCRAKARAATAAKMGQ